MVVVKKALVGLKRRFTLKMKFTAFIALTQFKHYGVEFFFHDAPLPLLSSTSGFSSHRGMGVSLYSPTALCIVEADCMSPGSDVQANQGTSSEIARRVVSR